MKFLSLPLCISVVLSPKQINANLVAQTTKCIIFHFSTSEAQHGPHWTEIKVSKGHISFWRLQGTIRSLDHTGCWQNPVPSGCGSMPPFLG